MAHLASFFLFLKKTKARLVERQLTVKFTLPGIQFSVFCAAVEPPLQCREKSLVPPPPVPSCTPALGSSHGSFPAPPCHSPG